MKRRAAAPTPNSRRRLLAATGLAAAPALLTAAALAQRMPRIGFVSPRAGDDENLRSFQLGMTRLGHVEGRSYAFESVRAELDPARYAPLALDLATRVDLIVLGGPVSQVAPEVSTRIPAVFVFSGDPVAAGIVRSLARPGGNHTGLSLLALELAGKRISLLKEAVPRLARVGAVTNPGHPGYANELEVNLDAARRIGIELVNREVRSGGEFAPALESLIREGCDGITSFPDALTLANRSTIIRAASDARLPTVFAWRNFTASGGLMSYGPNLVEAYARAAFFADRILRGTRAEDLPVELPTVIEFVLNTATARRLGVEFPPAQIARADEVIE